MKIVGICGSQKNLQKTSHSELILKSSGRLVEDEGGEFTLVRLLNYKIEYCDSCNQCSHHGKCKHTDNSNDEFKDVIKELHTADGFIFASPVYGEGIPAVLYNFLNRCWGFNKLPEGNPFKDKPLFNIVISGGVGNAAAIYEFENYRTYLGYKSMGYLGLGLLNSDSEMIGMTGFIPPTESPGLAGLVENLTRKLIKKVDSEMMKEK